MPALVSSTHFENVLVLYCHRRDIPHTCLLYIFDDMKSSENAGPESSKREMNNTVFKRDYNKANYMQLWPIALAPAIPLAGIALKNHPVARNWVIGGIAVSVLFYAHGAALGGSSSVT